MKHIFCAILCTFLTILQIHSAAVERSADSKTEHPAASAITNGYGGKYYAQVAATPSRTISQRLLGQKPQSHAEQIYSLIEANQFKKLRKYLASHKREIAINYPNYSHNHTFLKQAVYLGLIDIVRIFLEEVEADKEQFTDNEKYTTDEFGVIKEIDSSTIVYYNLLNTVESVDRRRLDTFLCNPPVFIALQWKRYDIVSYLIQLGATVAHTPAECIPRNYSRFLNRCMPEENLLTDACARKKFADVKFLLENHPEAFDVNAIDRNGHTPLTALCYSPYEYGQTDEHCELRLQILNLLVSHKADVNKRGRHETPLHIACYTTCKLPLAERLLKLGANVNLQSGGWRDTPLQMRLDGDIKDPAKDPFLALLLAYGADPDIAHDKNRTAYHLAIGEYVEYYDSTLISKFPSKEDIIADFHKGTWNKPEEPHKYCIHLRLQLLLNAANALRPSAAPIEHHDAQLPPEIAAPAPMATTASVEPDNITLYPTTEVSGEGI